MDLGLRDKGCIITGASQGIGRAVACRLADEGAHVLLVARSADGPPSRRGYPIRATLPGEPAALRALPGIGAYTAGAVASFAYERRAALVDTNVARVLTRVFAPRHDPRTPAGRRAAWAIAEHTLPRSGRVAYTHNQALMELGALVCTARVAHCERCPLRTLCPSRDVQLAPRGAAKVAGGRQRAHLCPWLTSTPALTRWW